MYMNKIYTFRGREFTEEEIELIKEVVRENWQKGRNKIAEKICYKLNWYQINGRLKKVSCLEAIRRMKEKGLIELPDSFSYGGYKEIKDIKAEDINFKEPKIDFRCEISKKTNIIFDIAESSKENKLWRYLMQRYHYLGYKRVVGRHIKYFIKLNNAIIALIGFSDGIFHHSLRDKWIGWGKNDLQKKRHLIINNFRFLILPWVKIRNLASRIISIACRVVRQDWKKRYGYEPLLIETFVDSFKFRGTIYKASNWIYLGKTEGKGRRGLSYYYHGHSRDYYVYPLAKDAISKLKQG